MKTVKISLLLLGSLASSSYADSFDSSWPAVPAEQGPSLGAVVADKVVDASNKFLATHVDRLSHDMLNLRIDGDRKAAKVGVGVGNKRLAMRVAGDIEVVDGTADVSAHVLLAFGGRQLDLKLPTINVASAEYKGERGVELRLPLMRARF